MAEATRVYDPDPESRRPDLSAAAVFYAAVAVSFAWFAFAVWRWRHGQQSDPEGRKRPQQS